MVKILSLLMYRLMSWKKGRKVAKGKAHSGTYGQTDRRRGHAQTVRPVDKRTDAQKDEQRKGCTDGREK